MEDREQNSAEDKVKWFKKMGVDEVGGTSAIDLETVEVGYLLLEYMCDDEGDLIMHYFWRQPPPPNAGPYRQVGNGLPAQEIYADWPSNFRDMLWNKLLDTFRLRDERNRVEIEWIPELSSWFTCVKGVATIMKPPYSLLERIASELVSDLSS